MLVNRLLQINVLNRQTKYQEGLSPWSIQTHPVNKNINIKNIQTIFNHPKKTKIHNLKQRQALHTNFLKNKSYSLPLIKVKFNQRDFLQASKIKLSKQISYKKLKRKAIKNPEISRIFYNFGFSPQIKQLKLFKISINRIKVAHHKRKKCYQESEFIKKLDLSQN